MKKREGESHLLLAYPQAEEWVSTVALFFEHAKLLTGRLEALSDRGQVPEPERTGRSTGSMSNLEVTLARV